MGNIDSLIMLVSENECRNMNSQDSGRIQMVFFGTSFSLEIDSSVFQCISLPQSTLEAASNYVVSWCCNEADIQWLLDNSKKLHSINTWLN